MTKKKQKQEDDYVWIKQSLVTKTDFDEFIGGWWHRNNHGQKTPEMILEDQICKVISDMDHNLDSIVHINKEDVELFIKKIMETQNVLKRWFYILHCFNEGRSSYA